MGAHVCFPFWLTNSDIRIVCTAWVMWQQSDLQNSHGGAINHIGPGINYCARDILSHCCPFTITLHNTLAPPSLCTSFFSSISPMGTKVTTYWSREKRRAVLSTSHSKCRLKLIEIVCWHLKCFSQDTTKYNEDFFFYILNSRPFFFNRLHPMVLPLW